MKTIKKNILFRVDANSSIGIGHFVRCFALAQFLKDQGYYIIFFGQFDNDWIKNLIKKENMDMVEYPWSENKYSEINEVLKYIDINNIDWIIIDGYLFDKEYFGRIYGSNVKVFAITDKETGDFPVNVILNQNYHSEYYCHYQIPKDSIQLLGMNYVLLRREFKDIIYHEKIKKNNRILITMGGSDFLNLTQKILNTFKKIKLNSYEINVVIGPAFTGMHSVEQMSKNESFHKIVIHQQPQNVLKLFQDSDTVITAAGSTVWELCYLGKAMILGYYVENQIPIERELSKIEAAFSLGDLKNITQENLLEKLNEFLVNENKLKLISENCRKLVDGNGVNRVFSTLEAL